MKCHRFEQLREHSLIEVFLAFKLLNLCDYIMENSRNANKRGFRNQRNEKKTYREPGSSSDEDPHHKGDDGRDVDFVEPPKKVSKTKPKSTQKSAKQLTPKERLQRLKRKTETWNKVAKNENKTYSTSVTIDDRQKSFRGVSHNHFFEQNLNRPNSSTIRNQTENQSMKN